MQNPILQILDVVKDFGGLRAVDHCSFEVQQGSITALIGPNGAGKTTLFNLITGFEKCTAGNIKFMGERIDGLAAHQSFNHGIVRTFQIPRELKQMTVIENLMLVPSNQTGENIWMSWLTPWKISREEHQIKQNALETLDFLKLSHLKNEYAGNLSTGQKKLLELARTLMAKPKMILLDEPGAGVNPTLMNSLVEDIERSRVEKNITFLLIEHDMDLVMRLCDPVVVMSNGKKLAEGPPSDIRQNKDVIEAYLGTSK